MELQEQVRLLNQMLLQDMPAYVPQARRFPRDEAG